MKTIPIVFSTDDNYVLPLAVAINSLVRHRKKTYEYKIYIFTEKLTDENKDILKRAGKDVSVEFVDVTDFMKGNSFYFGRHLTIATYYRLFIPFVLSQYDKVLYLDCDILVKGDISQLYNLELGDNVLGANFMPFDNTVWFNAGVLLFNVKQYLREDICNKCIEYLDKNKNLQYYDEDALNHVCKGKVKGFSTAYNFQTFFCFSEVTLIRTKIKKLKQIVVFHYSDKPWKVNKYPFFDLWWKESKHLPKDIYQQIVEKYYYNLEEGKNYYYYNYFFSSKIKRFFIKVKNKIFHKKNKRNGQ